MFQLNFVDFVPHFFGQMPILVIQINRETTGEFCNKIEDL